VSRLALPAGVESYEGVLWHRGCSGYDAYHGSIPLLLSAMGTLSVARLFDLRVLGGLSLGFYRNGFERAIVKRFADEWNFILVREPFTKYYLASAGVDGRRVFLVHDFAFSVGEECTKRVEEIGEEIRSYNSKPRVAISIRDYYYDHDPGIHELYIRFLEKLFRALIERFYVFIIPMSFWAGHENDIEFIKKLVKTGVIPGSAVPLYSTAYMDPEEVVCLLRNFDASIGVRTHFGILSAVVGIPTIHLYYEHKGRGIFKFSLRDSLPSISLYSAIHNPSTAINQIISHLLKLIGEKNNVEKDLRKLVQNNRRHNQKIVKQIISEGP
jgi:polysaccharide pyruvyl transferase WcaK-like protein